MRVGVVDCGTNTVRLLIADGPAGASDISSPGLTDVVRVLRFVRLGQGVDATHRFHPDALARTFAALDEYAGIIAANGPLDALRFLATSAARDATNREEFFAGVQARLGVTPDVISGDEEARLSFVGALTDQSTPPGPVLVLDIGGGSTELIAGNYRGYQGQVSLAHSYDMGSVRLRERFLAGDPPTADEITAARGFVTALLDDGPLPLPWVLAEFDDGAFIGVAGTNTTLSALHMGLTSYDANRVNNSQLAPSEIHALAEQLLATPVATLQARYPILEPLRAEVICAGALICDEIARRVGRPMIVRETDILDGAAIDLLRQG